MTEIVRNLIIINVLVFIGTFVVLGQEGSAFLALYYPASPHFSPYQLVTHMFTHAGVAHIAFNMYALYMFGPPLEVLWGGRRFLFFYIISGFGSALLNIAVWYVQIHYIESPDMAAELSSSAAMVGASGAIFGLLAGYAMSFPQNRLGLIFPPIELEARYFVLIYAAIELYAGIQDVDGAASSGVAHFAHLGGAVAGVLTILYWRKFGTRL